MKNLILTTFFLFSTSMIWAQTEKGKFFLGSSSNLSGGPVTIAPGSVGFAFGTFKSGPSSGGNSSNTSTDKVTTFNINPAGGYFIANGCVIGANISYGYYTSKAENESKSVSNIVSASTFLRYYFNQGKKIQPFVQAHGGLVTNKYNSIITSDLGSSEYESNDRGTTGGVQLGAAFFIGKYASLDVFADYNRRQTNSDGIFLDIVTDVKNTQNMVGLGLGLTFFL